MDGLKRLLAVGILSITLVPVAAAAAPRILTAPSFSSVHPNHKVGLGVTLVTGDGNQICGYDVDQDGTAGILASTTEIETFDQTTGAITDQFGAQNRVTYGVVGIFDDTVALVERYYVPPHTIYAQRTYEVVSPFTAGQFTGAWTPPIHPIDVQAAGGQNSRKTVFLAFQRTRNPGPPAVFTSDVARNTFGKVIKLDPNLFSEGFGPVLGAYLTGDDAVIALSPDGGAVGGRAPLNYVINLSTGAISQFSGFNNGFYHAGSVNGMATDPKTGIEATDTELNAQVEFYNVAQKTGITADQLPCTGPEDQSFSGNGIAFDPVHKLFLVADPAYACDGGNDGAIVVYNESGTQIEVIRGFKMAIGEPPAVVNPTTRSGWIFGPGFSNLQQFFY